MQVKEALINDQISIQFYLLSLLILSCLLHSHPLQIQLVAFSHPNNSFVTSIINIMIEEPSEYFTQLKYLKHSDLECLFIEPITLQYLVQEYNQRILTPKFKKKYQKELSTYIFRFKMRKNHREWVVRKRLNQFTDFANQMNKRYHQDAPPLPIYRENDLTSNTVLKKVQASLETFIKRILTIAETDQHLLHFLELLPEKYGSGIIHAEVRMKKHSGGRYTEATCGAKFRSAFCCCCRTWRNRYFTITDHCIFYTINKKSYDIKEMLTFTSKFKFYYGQEDTGYRYGVIIESAYRTLELIANNLYDYTIFISSLKQSLEKSPYSKLQRYESFAEVKENCYSKLYIDGENYFQDLCKEMNKAQKYIYITDWMLTPYFLLKRPTSLQDKSSRLDYVLESAGKRGVKVSIILYMEPEIALNNDSKFVQKYLEQMSPNITVLRHPNYILIPFLWSHHQKIVVIDEKCAFLGGLDLCYGRWDTQKHYLYNKDDLWQGADFCNFRIKDIYRPRNFLASNLNKPQPRMPWHDIGIQIRGPSVIDVTRHFVQYWNFVSFQTRFSQRDLLMQSGHANQNSRRRSTFFFNFSLRDNLLNKSTENQQIAEEQEEQKDYYDKFIEDQDSKFSLHIPNFSIDELKKYPKKIYNYITEGEDRHNEQKLLVPSLTLYLDNNGKRKGEQIHQVLRSGSTWSLGLESGNYESSIYLAYQDLIKNAKEFIYIENQFFICKKNVVCELLAQRILKAYHNHQKFRVIILMPLLPGFQGDILDESSAVMRVQLNWEYVTILRSKLSLFSRISEIPDPNEYIQILSLRNHAKIDGIPVTQILYIHSKLMIVDDQKLILGSANINDRSLLGNRDSQIGIIIEQKKLVPSKNNRLISSVVHQLRCQLYKQHFDLTGVEAEDYLNDKSWQMIQERARTNTKIYRQVFGCYPDNLMKTFKDIAEYGERGDIQLYDKLKDQIIGFVVQWPMKFLESQDLTLKPNQKQFFVPQINFT